MAFLDYSRCNRGILSFQVYIMNDAVQAGLLAWTIEITIAALMFLLLIHEENKVIKRRKKDEGE